MQDNISEIYVFIVTGILLFGLLAGFIVFFVISYHKKQQENAKEKLLLQSKFNEDLLKSTIEIQEKAFDDISRELHDNIGQQLSSAAIYLNLMLLENAANQDPKLQSCKDIIAESIQDLRQLSQTLLGEKISSEGLIKSVQLQINKINKLGISNATLETNIQQLSLNQKKEIILFRIIQEAISNATKHAPGCDIKITLNTLSDDSLYISVKDSGDGFTMSDELQSGVGLINMKSRAETIGAIYTITSKIGEGTLVTLNLPADRFA